MVDYVGQQVGITFSASVVEMKAVANASFDRAILKVAYHGENPNKSFISKADFEKAIPTMYNCPIVCTYDRESDQIGGHDIDIVSTDDGSLKIVNITQPVGVVPESAEWYWEEVEEEDGTVHEYLCVDVLVWKRQEAYAKLKANGFTAESMEIKVLAGSLKKEDRLFHITDFEFLAFCLLESQKPCFRSAGLQMFADRNMQTQFAEMMQEFKNEMNAITSAFAADIDIQMKGGVVQLNINELMQKYNLTPEEIDFSIDGMSEEELEAKFAELNASKNTAVEPEENTEKFAAEHPEEQPAESKPEVEQPLVFSLTASQYTEELRKALRQVKFINARHPEWGECTRYYYVDCDLEAGEVYAYDEKDNSLYGLKFSMNGDQVVLNLESAKRKKIVYADFNEGEQTEVTLFNAFNEVRENDNANFNAKISELEAYRDQKLNEEREVAIQEVFAKFSDLEGVEMFEQLRSEHANLSIDALTEKCFAIRGRQAEVVKFSAKDMGTRLPVENIEQNDNEPYGGLFHMYGVK